MASDERESENLLYTYAKRLDAGDFAGVADLFAHGRILPGPDSGAEESVVGRAGVLAMYETATRLHADGTPRSHHVTTNALVEVNPDGEQAQASSYFTVLQQTDSLPLQVVITGQYEDTFHKIEGRWAFATRTMHVKLLGDLHEHLLFDLGGA